jgi:hypothetical protein
MIITGTCQYSLKLFQYLLAEHCAWPSGFINLCSGILCPEAKEKNYNFFVEPMVEYSSGKNIISDSIEHILIMKYVTNDSYSPSTKESMSLRDEFSGMGCYIFIMLSKNSNKATIIEQTGGEKVDEKKALKQFANYISDYTFRYNWQDKDSGRVIVKSISKQKNK